MKREQLGTMKCPECGADGAQIKAQKNGLLYRWCAEGCNAQFFARSVDQEYTMRQHIKAASVTDTAPEMPEKVAAPIPEAKPAKANKATKPEEKPALPKKVGTGNALLDLIQGVTP